MPHYREALSSRTWARSVGRSFGFLRLQANLGHEFGGGHSCAKPASDRIQNHALQDVSSKSYDRWTYMPEKRAAMDRWDEFVRDLLSQTNAK